MERLIWLAWRAFWVGLGAAGVLVAQTLLAPPPAPSAEPAPPATLVAPVPSAPVVQLPRT